MGWTKRSELSARMKEGSLFRSISDSDEIYEYLSFVVVVVVVVVVVITIIIILNY